LKLLAFVKGALGTTSQGYFTPGRSALDGGVMANGLIEHLLLYKYSGGQYIQLSTSTQSINNEGYVTFNGLGLNLPANSSTTTLVVKGDVHNFAQWGQIPDGISFDINNCHDDLFIFNQLGDRVQSGPNNINRGVNPIVYHTIIELTLPTPGWFEATNITASSVQLYWGWWPYSPYISHVDGYKLWRSLDPHNFPVEPIEYFGYGQYMFYDANLTPNTHYYYKFVAYNNISGDSPPLYDEARTLNTPIAPAFLEVTATSTNSLFLSWENVENEDGYRIWRSLIAYEFPTTTIAELPANTTNYLDTGLLPNTYYHYKLTAFNRWGESEPVYEGNSTNP
jgi:hypothetical protein